MANGIDESAFLGSALNNTPVNEANEKTEERVKTRVDKRRDTYVAITPAIETLQIILEKEIDKESNLVTIQQRAVRRAKADGTSRREALSDELLYSTGRLDAFKTIEALFAAAKQDLRGNHE